MDRSRPILGYATARTRVPFWVGHPNLWGLVRFGIFCCGIIGGCVAIPSFVDLWTGPHAADYGWPPVALFAPAAAVAAGAAVFAQWDKLHGSRKRPHDLF